MMIRSQLNYVMDSSAETYLVEGLVVGRGVVAIMSAGWGVAKGEELSTSPIAASSCRENQFL